MRNSSWELSKIGLLDFWYYDEQEFNFLDGRMLLRGSNGSGKSVTMQSFIPLLLDGNISPERLDPFGSRERRMVNYLIDDDDTRQERTGYLYMEFKRQECEEYITVGMGLNAKKNRQLDKWYFVINNERVGSGVLLYNKKLGEKIACSRLEMKNRLEGIGKIFDSQNEYMETVNNYLFGFESIDEYKELITLLIQLRKPKLSKDFKPTIINGILTQSLQTLSEDDLREMSSAIENIDRFKDELSRLRVNLEAAEEIKRVYDEYNKVSLLEKSTCFIESFDDYKNLKKSIDEDINFINESEQKRIEFDNREMSLENSEEILEEEMNSLKNNDVFGLKNDEIEIKKSQINLQSDKVNKMGEESSKTEKLSTAKDNLKQKIDDKYVCEKKIKISLKELKNLSDISSFVDYQYMEKDFLENINKDYDFSLHQKNIERYIDDLDMARRKIEELNRLIDKQGKISEKLEKENNEKLCKEKEEDVARNEFYKTKEETKEGIWKWNNKNVYIKLDEKILKDIYVKIDNFNRKSDYTDIKQKANNVYNRVKSEFEIELHRKQDERDSINSDIKEIKEKIDYLENNKEMEPERTKEVIQNRERLKEEKIPFTEFYKMIDFHEDLSEEEKNNIEEAMFEMGILDAIVIDESYREHVLSFDKGLCDKYIFADVKKIECNIQKKFVLSDSLDLMENRCINSVLNSIGIDKEANTWIDTNGYYGIGVVSGKISKNYKACFIGADARERLRLRKIKELEELVEEKNIEIENIEKNIGTIEEKKIISEKELNCFPKGDNLSSGIKLIMECELKLKNIEERIKETLTDKYELDEKCRVVKLEVNEICDSKSIPKKIDQIEEFYNSMNDYRAEFGEMKDKYIKYIIAKKDEEHFAEKISELQHDLDNIRYDITKIIDKINYNEEKLKSIREQLKLKNLEEIEAKIELCKKNLYEARREKGKVIELRAGLNRDVENTKKGLCNKEIELFSKDKRQTLGRKFIIDEISLEYVDIRDILIKNKLLLEDATIIKSENLESRKVYDLINDNKEENSEIGNNANKVFLEKVNNEKNAEENIEKDTWTSHVENFSDKELYKLCVAINESLQLKKGKSLESLNRNLYEIFFRHKYNLTEYSISMDKIFIDEENIDYLNPERYDITAEYKGKRLKFNEMLLYIVYRENVLKRALSESDRELFEDILANTISKKIRARINSSKRWVEKMNKHMSSMDTSSGIKLSLKWKNKKAESEEQLGTKELVELLQMDSEVMKQRDRERLSKHFRSKIEEARKIEMEEGNLKSFHNIMKEVLDYRQWFEFQVICQKEGEAKKELTDKIFFTMSGGEKAMSMYVPLFSAVVAKYESARIDAPRIVSLDEAFAGVDQTNIKDMFRLMVEFKFNFIINSQSLWGDYETVPGIAIHQLVRKNNNKFVTVISYEWNGKKRIISET